MNKYTTNDTINATDIDDIQVSSISPPLVCTTETHTNNTLFDIPHFSYKYNINHQLSKSTLPTTISKINAHN